MDQTRAANCSSKAALELQVALFYSLLGSVLKLQGGLSKAAFSSHWALEHLLHTTVSGCREISEN
jgi:hypothetical protein